MEVLLFALFFISALIFFIAGKDDFGRTERKLIIKEDKTVKDEENKEAKVADKGEIKPQEETLEDKVKVADKGNIEPQDETLEDKVKVADKGNIEPQDEIKKDS